MPIQGSVVKQNVVVFGRVSSADVMADLRERFTVDICLDPLGADREAFLAALAGADGMIGANLPVDAALLRHAPRLRVIASVSAGYDNYDLAELRARGITLTHTPDAVTETTADTGFMLLMMTARRAVELAEHVRSGRWTASIGESMFGLDVHGKRLGIIGLGRIGAALARRAHLGFAMPIVYAGNSDKPRLEAELGATRRTLDELLAEADFIAVCVPLTRGTHHLIGARELARMRPGSILINISRGPVVDEAALIEALRAGQLRAAGLDVFATEPLPAGSPLRGMANVVALPHVGSATVEARALMARTAANDLIAVLAGRVPVHPVPTP